jgi:transcriptional regulator of acetoin/glycerol metabolism
MPADLPAELLEGPERRVALGDFNGAKRQAIDAFEITYLRELLAHTQGNISRAAALAGLQRTVLHRLLVRHGLSGDRFRTGGPID